ncbi:MAG: aldo/keto reductase [Clostridiales bacterium]|nr:aldo/keto reductase [Clostridiales bacterium]
MQYRRDKSGSDISILGYGCMRFTKKGTSIDMPKAEKEILEAVENGVNYFDTAYIYPGSEAALGEIVERNNLRSRIKIATKLPQYLIKNEKSIGKYFDEQLSRLRTDYIDYYLMHMLTDLAAWEKLCNIGIREWIDAKKKSGEIKNIGFSFHGNTENFLEILEAYDWDFCQIQYNYVDENTQAGRKGLERAYEKGIPVIIMEPLRGGKLVSMLPDSAKKIIHDYNPSKTPAYWAFGWLYNQPAVTCVLSGMNSVEMIRENCRVADEVFPDSFSGSDMAMIEKVKDEIKKKTKVGCTGCGYCMPCPKGIDIPTAFRCYNNMYTENKRSGRWEYVQCIGMNKNYADIRKCVSCGKCIKHCPQSINIPEELKKAQKELIPLPYRIVIKVMRMVKFR